MTVITVLYPAADDARFDFDYYLASHMELVRRSWMPMGLTGTQVLRGVPGPDGKAPTYTVMTMLTFTSMDAFKQAAAHPHGAEIFADVPKFTNLRPVLQCSDVAG